MYNYIQLYFSVFAEDMALSLPSVSLFPPALIHGGTLLCNPWKRTYILCSFTQVLHMLFLQKGGCFALSIGFAMTTILLFLWLYLTKYYMQQQYREGETWESKSHFYLPHQTTLQHSQRHCKTVLYNLESVSKIFFLSHYSMSWLMSHDMIFWSFLLLWSGLQFC